MWRGKRPRIVKTMLKQKSKIRILTPFQLQDLVYSSRNQDSVVLAKEQTNQWNGIGNPKIDFQINCQLIFDKGAKRKQWGQDNLFNKQCWNNQTSTYKKMNLNTDLIPFTKFNPKWIIGLNVKCKSIKLREDNRRKSK